MTDLVERIARAIAAAEWRRNARMRQITHDPQDTAEKYAERSWGLWEGHAHAAIAALEWQPIETAPKDGQLFLCWPRDSEHATASWDGGHFCVSCCGQRADSLSHWMPLPMPPVGGE